MQIEEKIKRAYEESIRVKEQFFKENISLIREVAEIIAKTLNEGGKILIFGNGGSATDASHIAAEFVNRFKRERPGLPAIALNTDMAVITAIANDYDYSEIFSKQIKAFGQQGDIAIGISTSGSSRNVIKGIETAKKRGLKTIAFTSIKGEKLISKVDYAFAVSSEETPRIQETHITLGHILCELVEDILFEIPVTKKKVKQ
ncbi:MAG: D-sedoheptulose 7-phosphate isomerase [Thermodesulfovibrio sp.]|uniref:D-sedoheptulose-7-phosphate isomerase n=1 Tax=unclassified Thermodesulfovibrio TaxID=2645936 RepID=UPI00083AB2D2|nr:MULTISPECIES: D-sedoheptulose 7-phosphate isomerase [unclassified Thermodesulfovibrio]MDI1471371.1 D-sedoheptulose 7-phosphate isomerase [Thermodesulfovibrio sp. 1176]MDI6714602.1 D-sedoheptulose 7-phosphate isomerase [Thermodesulfovibrio sp.]ODA44324.1 Phosphoheptose isomerase 1 [Thermodesulfovibrio sp. N1]